MFHLSPRKLHLQEAAECDMKPNEGEVALKRYIYIYFQTLGYCGAHIQPHVRCALKESTLG